MSRTIRIGHLARVEGHGGITIEVQGRRVRHAHFDVFEGLRLIEGLVRGRPWHEVSQIVSRICSICSVGHALTSIKATEAAFGVVPTRRTVLLRDLLFRGENIESHALHLFLLALPDYLGYTGAVAMAGDYPETVRLGLQLKKLGNTIQEVIGGRAIHPVNAIVGGFGREPTRAELQSLRSALLQGLARADRVVDLVSSVQPVDCGRSDVIYAAMRSPSGYGYYEGDEIVFRNGVDRVVSAASLRNAIEERAVVHSNAKHSRIDGHSFMVGALARLTINGATLGTRAAGALQRLGLSLPSRDPLDNNVAQAVELVHDIETAYAIIEQLLDLHAESEAPVVQPRAGTGTAVTEAPRGLLLHSYTYDDDGHILAADVITPTALNAANIEERLGSCVEQSRAIDDERLTLQLEMIARAYDPCISCSVHLVRWPDGDGPGRDADGG